MTGEVVLDVRGLRTSFEHGREVLVADGRATPVDETAVRREAAAAIEPVWRLARERGHAPEEPGWRPR